MNNKKKIMLIIIVSVFIIFLGIITSIFNNQKTESSEIPKIENLDLEATQKYPKTNLPESDLENEILWQENRLLTWKDFTGEVYDVGLAEKTCANTNAGLLGKTVQGILDSEPCHYIFTEVNYAGFFTKDKSWVKEELKPYCPLNHEQRHFDISEVYTRILTQKIIEETKGKAYLCPENVTASLWTNIHKETDKLIDEIFDIVSSEFEKIDAKYETETNHGIIFEKQQEWDNKIDGCLHGTWENIEDCWK